MAVTTTSFYSAKMMPMGAKGVMGDMCWDVYKRQMKHRAGRQYNPRARFTILCDICLFSVLDDKYHKTNGCPTLTLPSLFLPGICCGSSSSGGNERRGLFII